MNLTLKKTLLLLALAGAAGGVWLLLGPGAKRTVAPQSRGALQAAPVEVAPIEHGPLELRRTFSGALEAPGQFVIAPKVSGRVERLVVDLADPVSRGQVVAELDNDEYVQAVAQARAELAVAEANLVEARSSLEIAGRELERVTRLRERGVASEANLDTARANRLARQAQLEVAKAQVTRAEAALETARIRLGYTRISADWSGGDDQRVVAERFVDEGQTVSANAPLLRIVELDPITAVIFVTETDYGRLQPGQEIALTTDAYPANRFSGRIDRIAPVFREATRQARVELSVENPEHRLKPGMFVRATVVLEQVADAVIVPEQALTQRNDRTGVFVVSEDGGSVAWRVVQVGIREGGRVQVSGEGLAGRVVTLGQQLVDDGSAIVIPSGQEQKPAAAKKDDRS
ncbi:MexH family multidrug efflux RND transporter periplasmic adaptor subunit [Desulfuromonas versatilis]|uniref:MexH family multidrug efflux RND transporter periplasmic adaptor subunit n=1 Tax=Desulfuromonas versatilis TaxID=2802975 RepID=A0ABN6DWH4_9BACT|nr:efflux RND transporter periplasmic adaptor subunit [Desulfuromonas versatilis]BCR04478.1 MexH family multidrug efflux RND transporter periplasmic adaptor subunit [Desulfuromonas versatilis]